MLTMLTMLDFGPPKEKMDLAIEKEKHLERKKEERLSRCIFLPDLETPSSHGREGKGGS